MIDFTVSLISDFSKILILSEDDAKTECSWMVECLERSRYDVNGLCVDAA